MELDIFARQILFFLSVVTVYIVPAMLGLGLLLAAQGCLPLRQVLLFLVPAAPILVLALLFGLGDAPGLPPPPPAPVVSAAPSASWMATVPWALLSVVVGCGIVVVVWRLLALWARNRLLIEEFAKHHGRLSLGILVAENWDRDISSRVLIHWYLSTPGASIEMEGEEMVYVQSSTPTNNPE